MENNFLKNSILTFENVIEILGDVFITFVEITLFMLISVEICTVDKKNSRLPPKGLEFSCNKKALSAAPAAMVYRKVEWFCLIWGIYVKIGKEMADLLLLIVSQTLLSTLQVQAKLQKLAKKSVNIQNAGPQQFF